MSITGNKGEWSELYAFLKLLSLGKLYVANERAERVGDVYIPINRILRNDDQLGQIEYAIRNDSGDVDVYIESQNTKTIGKAWISRASKYIYSEILEGKNSFEIDKAPDVMEEMKLKRIAAAPSDKTDIKLQIHDIHSGYDSLCGFSIKSELGSPPTLLNASGATNFVFEISGVSDSEIKSINRIDTRTKILDRMNAICSIGSMKYVKTKSDIFSANLMLIDTYMEEIISAMLIEFYLNRASNCKSLIDIVEEKNPLGYPRRGFYEYKFKRFLCSVALGMMPSKSWDGIDEANGGYIIVKQNGDVLAYHLYNRNSFETYLLNNTKFERGSTRKHGFASIYKDDAGRSYINLNLQIRFT